MWICSKCGAENSENDNKVCSSCGELREESVEETESVETESVETEAIEAEVEAVEAETEEAVSAPSIWICPICEAECDGEVCPVCGEAKPEEANIVDFVPKKNNSKIIALAVLIVAVVLVTAAFFVKYLFFSNDPVKGTGENNKITYSDMMEADNAISDENVAISVNGIDVSKDLFESMLANKALAYQQEFCYAENGSYDTSLLDNFKWTDVDKEKKKTHKEIVIENTVDILSEIYSIVDIGNDHKIKLSKKDKEAIDEQIANMKNQYGEDFETLLKANGFKNENAYKELLMVDQLANLVIIDMQEHPERYLEEDLSVYDSIKNPETISAKHILIKVAQQPAVSTEATEAVEGTQTAPQGLDDASAKAKADEILKKIKDGEDFDTLMEANNEDTSQPAEGYSFQKGGQMAKEFEDAAFALKIGEISDVVKTSYGYHIIKREAGYTDVVNYAKSKAEVKINKDFIEGIEITANLKKLEEETEKVMNKNTPQTTTNGSGQATQEMTEEEQKALEEAIKKAMEEQAANGEAEAQATTEAPSAETEAAPAQ